MISRQGESSFGARRQPPVIFTPCTAPGHHDLDIAALEAWPSARCYTCSFCCREFKSAQALGGHMNIHRRDRARLRTCNAGSLALPLHHTDSSPALQSTAKVSRAAVHQPSEVACGQESTSMCDSLDSHSDPVIRAATSASQLLTWQLSATGPNFLHRALPALPDSQCCEKSDGSFAVLPVLDVVSNRVNSSSPTTISPIQSEAPRSLPPLPRRKPGLQLQDSFLKPVPKSLNTFCSEARSRDLNISWCEAKGVRDSSYEGNQSSRFILSNKRMRRNSDTVTAVDTSCESKARIQLRSSGKDVVSSTKSSIFLHTAADHHDRPCSTRLQHEVHNDREARSSLDLELRLGQCSPAPTDRQCHWTYKNGHSADADNQETSHIPTVVTRKFANEGIAREGACMQGAVSSILKLLGHHHL